MHEIAIACALFDLVAKQARRFPDKRVTGVTMSIGGLQALEPASIGVCFELLAEGTKIAGAVLTILRRPISTFCRDCDREQVVDSQFRCGYCNGENVSAFVSHGMTLDKISVQSDSEAKEIRA